MILNVLLCWKDGISMVKTLIYDKKRKAASEICLQNKSYWIKEKVAPPIFPTTRPTLTPLRIAIPISDPADISLHAVSLIIQKTRGSWQHSPCHSFYSQVITLVDEFEPKTGLTATFHILFLTVLNRNEKSTIRRNGLHWVGSYTRHLSHTHLGWLLLQNGYTFVMALYFS